MNNIDTKIKLTNKPKRQIEFDLLKAIAIYLVILGHIIQYITDDYFYNNDLWCVIYTFHMPLFLIISGYFYNINGNTHQNNQSFIRHKFYQLIYPGIIIAIMIVIIDLLRGHKYLHFPLRLFFCELWFLKALFIIFCICTLYKILKQWQYKLLLLSSTIFIFFYFPFDYWGISYAFPFFLTGIIIRNNYNRIEENTKSILLYSFIVFIITSLFWNKNYLLYHTPYELTYHSIMIAFFRYVYGTNIVILILTTTILISKKNIYQKKYINTIANIGQNTLYIYIIQYVIIEKFLWNLQYSTNNQYLDNFIIAPLISIISLIIFNFLSNITLKNIYLRHYLWRKQ